VKTTYTPKGYDSLNTLKLTKTTKSTLSNLKSKNKNTLTPAQARSKPGAKKKATKSTAKLERQLLRDKAKAVMAASKQGTPLSQPTPSRLSLDGSVNQHKAYALALAYEDQLGVYRNQPTLKYLKGIVRPGDRSYDVWLRAAIQADQLGVSYKFYVKAQFYWFDEWFSRAPKPYEMASFKTKLNSKERVRLYEQEISKGQANPDRKVLGRVRTAPKISQSVRFTQSARQLASLMKNYEATEEEILKVFAKGKQAALYFDRGWKAGQF
jgi:hypothetical protein